MVNLLTPLDGLLRAEQGFDAAAGQIAKVPSDPGSGQDTVDLSTETVNLMQSRNAFETNLKALHVSDQMTKSLLSVFG